MFNTALITPVNFVIIGVMALLFALTVHFVTAKTQSMESAQ